MGKLNTDYQLENIIISMGNNGSVVMTNSVLILRRHRLMIYLGTKCHDICSLLSNGSAKNKMKIK